ncbi:MAG: diacylglycerol/polyprenol kinase family protein [Candidatus Thorarchaeota archaeon]
MVFNPFGVTLALLWDFIAMIITIVALLALVQINAILQKKKVLSQIITRKLVHILAGPVFILMWMLFSGEYYSRYIAVIVPILFVVQFVAIGTGRMKNEDFVASMSRTGDPKELLQGTLYYSIVMVIMTIFWFYIPASGIGNASPTALIIIGCVSGGDGIADIIGRKFGGERKFGIKGSQKTIVGSLGMLFGSIMVSSILVLIFSLEVATFNIINLILPIILISIVATIVEAISPKGIDNFTIFIAVIIVVLVLIIFFPDLYPYTF